MAFSFLGRRQTVDGRRHLDLDDKLVIGKKMMKEAKKVVPREGIEAK